MIRPYFRVLPGGPLRGRITVPGDKSISHRAMLLALLARGETEIVGFLESGDCIATRDAVEQLGATVTRIGAGHYRVRGRGGQPLLKPDAPLDLGNSGTGLRLLAGLAAGAGAEVTLTGDDSLRGRPMARIVDPLRRMGASIVASDGRAPLVLSAGAVLNGAQHRLEVASAQVKSALLLAALGANGETRIEEPAATRDHTERMLPAFGVALARDGNTVAVTGPAVPTGTHVAVPRDLSSAAFFIVAASIAPGSEIMIPGVGVNPTRTGVIDALLEMGADISLVNTRDVCGEPVADIVVRQAALTGIDVAAEVVPRAIDEIPALLVAAAAARGTTRVRDAAELRVKESDRLSAMAQGLARLGVDVSEYPDGIAVRGGSLSGATIESHDDHRIAMAFAVAGLIATDPLIIRDVANVATSFPDFVTSARRAGLRIEEGPSKNDAGAAPVITIDGPSGAGKGTISHLVGARLGWHLLDSGALYRLVGLAAYQRGIALDAGDELAEMARGLEIEFSSGPAGEEQVRLDGREVGAQIRTEHCGAMASKVAVVPQLRAALVELQRGFRRAPGLVADGRDMGTVIFPSAKLKIFLTAGAKERARRRHKQLKEKGIDVSLSALYADIVERDRRDANRPVAPLRPAADAMIVDTTSMGIDEVVETVLSLALATEQEPPGRR